MANSNVAGLQLSPLHFRYEEVPFWDASECCLIQADLTYLHHGRSSTTDTGIVTNPYMRVTYILGTSAGSFTLAKSSDFTRSYTTFLTIWLVCLITIPGGLSSLEMRSSNKSGSMMKIRGYERVVPQMVYQKVHTTK